MSTLGPIIAVALAVIAAGSVAVIAWQLSADDFHKSFESDDDGEDNNDLAGQDETD